LLRRYKRKTRGEKNLLRPLLPTSSNCQAKTSERRKQDNSEDEMPKGQLRSNREKKKPKADKNKKKSAPASSPFSPVRLTEKGAGGRKF
jgi:hypothetical protein